MTVPAFAFWALPLGVGVGVGIVAAIVANRDEVEDFLETASLSVMQKLSEAIEKRRTQRSQLLVPAYSESNEKSESDLFPGTATLSGRTYKDEKGGEEPDTQLTRRRPHGLQREDIDQWILSQDSESTTVSDYDDIQTSSSSSTTFSGARTPSESTEQ